MAQKATVFQFLLNQQRISTDSLLGGSVYFYSAGTTTPKAVWLDRDKVSVAANPYSLDSNSTAEIFGDGNYRVVIKDVFGATKYDRDGINVVDYITSGQYTAIDSDYASLNAVITAVGSTPSTLLIKSANSPLVSNATVPSTLVIKFEYPGSIANGSYLLAINSSTINYPVYKVLTGSGAVSGLSFARPEWWGALPGNTSDDSAAMALALGAVATYGTLKFNPGVYSGYLSVRRNNITISGEGSAITTLKQPAATKVNVLELGDTASGNSAASYSGLIVKAITLDGNKTNSTAPTNDLTNWGLPLTKISNFHIEDVNAINCFSGGVGIFINSNYGYAEVYTENCGGSSYASGYGLDVNSSKYCILKHRSQNDKYGTRLLDNCWDNVVTSVVKNPTATGFTYYNQTTNESYGNIIDVTVNTTTTGDGVIIGPNCRNSQIRATVTGSAGNSMQLVNAPGYNPSNNEIFLSSRNAQNSAILIGGDDNTVVVMSYLDGLQGGQGAWGVVDITGNRNNVSVSSIDSATWKTRSAYVRAGATSNRITVARNDIATNANLISMVSDAGTDTHVAPGRFRSAAFTWTDNTLLTYAHYLYALPRNVQLIAKCLSTEAGYQFGDYAYNITFNDGTGKGLCNIGVDSTNVYFATGDNKPFVINRVAASTADFTVMTPSKWSFYLIAE